MLRTTTCTTASEIILSSGVTVNFVSVPEMLWVQHLGYGIEEESWFSFLQ
jgi:hypothetical protein